MSSSEKPSSKGQAWFCTTGLPSDIVVEVDDMTFHLHKFPLMSRSRKLHNLIKQQEAEAITHSTVPQEEEDEDEIVEEQCHVTFTDFPGGCEAFEMAAKFCYGVKMELSPSNVASLRCAGEFLEMTEEYSEDNLISKTEKFLSQNVLKSLGNSIKTLKSCERLFPMAEDLGITERCIESVISRASSADPALFGWPVSEAAASASKQILWNGIDAAGRRNNAGAIAGTGAGDSWFEDLALLRLPLFKRLILAMKDAELNPEIIETCVMYYAKKYIPGVSRSSRKPLPSSSSVSSEAEQKEILETVVMNLPPEKNLNSSTATRFLFGLLRTANILNASESCRNALEKKIGLQLEEATLDDLLVPSYSYLNETLYDVDCVERILSHFLHSFEARNSTAGVVTVAEVIEEGEASESRSPAMMLVGKLIDGYLSEIASDANLKPERFYNFAISLPDQARLFDDGLYRAVDVYLKAHPWVSEAEREKICGLLDCQKLTLEACTHAAQNERLPLRAVVQVLFFEQLQLRHAIAETLISAETGAEISRHSATLEGVEEGNGEVLRLGLGLESEQVQEGNSTWRVAVRENQVLRLDMDSMRTRVHQLERECSSMKRVIEKIEKPAAANGGGWRTSLGKKLGCKFKTQVCDSHQSAVVDTRKGKHRSSQQQHAHHAHHE